MVVFILQWILVLIFLCVFVLLLIWIWGIFKAKVPFLSIPTSVLADVHRALDIKEGSTVYHINCGDARMLLYSAHRMPNASYVGMETNPFPLLFARFAVWRYMRSGKHAVTVINKDFFAEDLSKATHVIMYLYPNIMDDLLGKLENELAPGTRLVSVAFRFTQKPALSEIDLERSTYASARKIYVYEF